MPAQEHNYTFSSYLQNDYKADQGSDGLGGNFVGILMDAQYI